jgi:hypothetical protein
MIRLNSVSTCVAAALASLRLLVPSDFLRKTRRGLSSLRTRATAS